MSYHHFEDPKAITSKLGYFLKPGGYLFVADVESTEDHEEILPSQDHHVVAHTRGFTKEEMQSFFLASGLESFEFKTVTKARKDGREVNIFLARAIKPER